MYFYKINFILNITLITIAHNHNDVLGLFFRRSYNLNLVVIFTNQDQVQNFN
jgi:hypothetical protein